MCNIFMPTFYSFEVPFKKVWKKLHQLFVLKTYLTTIFLTLHIDVDLIYSRHTNIIIFLFEYMHSKMPSILCDLQEYCRYYDIQKIYCNLHVFLSNTQNKFIQIQNTNKHTAHIHTHAHTMSWYSTWEHGN